MLAVLILYVLGTTPGVLQTAAPARAPAVAEALPEAIAQPAAPGQAGLGTIVRRDIMVPWRCGGEVSIVQTDGVNAPIRRARGASVVWTTRRDRLIVAPFAYVTGPSSNEPAMTVVHFDITDQGWLSLLEGDGRVTFYGDRSDNAGPEMCSGARIFVWIELDD